MNKYVSYKYIKLAVLFKKDAKILVFEYYRYHHFREVKGKKIFMY